MAKDVVFEISWLRPLKLIGLANLLCAIICLILCMALEDWVTSDESKDFQFYMSLWKQCQKINPIDSAATTDGQEEAEVDWTCNNSVLRGGMFDVLIAIPICQRRLWPTAISISCDRPAIWRCSLCQGKTPALKYRFKEFWRCVK